MVEVTIRGEDWFELVNSFLEQVAERAEIRNLEDFSPTMILELARMHAYDLPGALSILLGEDMLGEDNMYEIHPDDHAELLRRWPQEEYHIRNYNGYTQFST